MRYIELNPVRAGIAGTPAEYRWSSFHANALGNVDALVDPHPIFRRLGVSAAERHAAYRELFDMSIREEEVRAIREATQKAWALGGEHFQRQVSDLSRRASPVKTGRPKRGSDSSFHAK
jgi:putative transposase